MKQQQQHQQQQRIVKNRQYYRRTGATWTDLYHTPAHRLKLIGYRPDLDAEHERMVAKRKRADEVKEAERLRARRKEQLLTK